MSSRVAVAGGTGLVGRLLVEALRARGHEVVVLARSIGVDLLTGAGLDLTGTDVVVDVTNVQTTRRATSVRFFETVTRTLLAAAESAGVRHHVVLSIVGIDRVDLGYYAGKRRQEDLVLAGPVPSTVLRTTQFHELAGQLLGRGGPVALVPRMRCQPVAAAEVAGALADLVAAPPAGFAPEVAGPQPEELVDLVRRLRQARGGRRPVSGVRLLGAAGRSAAGGGLLPTAAARTGPSFAQWLEAAPR